MVGTASLLFRGVTVSGLDWEERPRSQLAVLPQNSIGPWLCFFSAWDSVSLLSYGGH